MSVLVVMFEGDFRCYLAIVFCRFTAKKKAPTESRGRKKALERQRHPPARTDRNQAPISRNRDTRRQPNATGNTQPQRQRQRSPRTRTQPAETRARVSRRNQPRRTSATRKREQDTALSRQSPHEPHRPTSERRPTRTRHAKHPTTRNRSTHRTVHTASATDQHHSTRRQTRQHRTQDRRNDRTRPRKTNDRIRQSRRNSNTKHGTPPKTNTHNRFFLPLRLSLFSSMRPVSRVAIGVWGVPR